MNKLLLTALLLGPCAGAQMDTDTALQQAIASPQRKPAYAARDTWRHPFDTLTFFGLRPDSRVVEISPGGGWYTEILAPYLHAKGQLILAADDPDATKTETIIWC